MSASTSLMRITVPSLAAALLLGGCGAAEEEPNQYLEESAAVQAPSPTDGAADAATETATATPGQSSEFLETPAGEAASYVLKVLNAEGDSEPQDWDARLHADFQAELSPAELAEVINTTVRPQGPWTATAYQGEELVSLTRLESGVGELDMHIALDEEEQLIQTLFFGEAPEPVETAESFHEIEDRLTDFPGTVRALIVQDGEPMLALHADEPAPLASTSKLYVLLAVVNAIDAGETDWEEKLAVTDELRSLPSGTLQDQPQGYETTLYDVAHRMIEISDNTATDMLIDRLGRDAVEDAVSETEHHDPRLLRPFLTTRELFQLRWGHPEMAADWEGADEQSRRESLEELARMPMDIESEDVGAGDINFAIDWHATAYDVAAVHRHLAERVEDHPELVSILGRNPGLPTGVQDPWWESLGFKGGSVPGVLTGSWHALGPEGTERTVVLLAEHDDAGRLGEESTELFSLAQDALTIQP